MNKIQDFLPAREREHKPYVPPPYVMPYLPKEAEKEIERHEKYTHQPAFVLAFQRFASQCPNCGGLGSVMVKFCEAGPFQQPKAPNVAVTYFEGNNLFPAGWYKIKDTRSWTCPECKGQG
jgi:hypothetical protein